MTKEKLYQYFMDFVESTYDGLAYAWQFSTWKRVCMDRSSYLNAAEHFFEEYYQPKLLEMGYEDAMTILIKEFDKDTEILEVIGQNL